MKTTTMKTILIAKIASCLRWVGMLIILVETSHTVNADTSGLSNFRYDVYGNARNVDVWTHRPQVTKPDASSVYYNHVRYNIVTRTTPDPFTDGPTRGLITVNVRIFLYLHSYDSNGKLVYLERDVKVMSASTSCLYDENLPFVVTRVTKTIPDQYEFGTHDAAVIRLDVGTSYTRKTVRPHRTTCTKVVATNEPTLLPPNNIEELPNHARRLGIDQRVDNIAKGALDENMGSDILWRHDNGMVHHWILENGIRKSGNNVYPTAVDTKWRIVDIDDMDKDGDGDLVWIHENGSLAVWLQENGAYQSNLPINNSAGTAATAGTGWNFVDVEDLDDDGDGDYLWRHTDGRLKYWLVENGSIVKSADVFSNLTAQGGSTSAEMTAEFKSWKIVDVEDLDFDRHADIVFRNTDSSDGRVISMLLKDGVIANYLLASAPAVASSWKIVDVADMNRDGHADIIWRNDNGTMHTWTMRGGIKQSGFDMWPGFLLDKDWVVRSVVDFDGDGHGDILMRNTSGQVHGWRCVNGERQKGINVSPSPTGLEWTINTHR